MARSRLFYFSSEAVQDIRESRRATFATVVAIVMCLLMIGSILLLADILLDSLQDKMKTSEYYAYVDDALSDQEAYALQSQLLSIPNVSSAAFVSREAAKLAFAEDLNSTELEEIPASVFRHRYVLTYADSARASATTENVKNLKGIASVYGTPVVSEKFSSLARLIETIALTMTALLLIVSFILIENSIVSSAARRYDDLKTLRLCGVSELHIRFPMLLKTLYVGMSAAVLAFLLQWGLYALFCSNLGNNSLVSDLNPPLFSHYAKQIAILFGGVTLLVCIAAGLLTGERRVRRKLNRQKRKYARKLASVLIAAGLIAAGIGAATVAAVDDSNQTADTYEPYAANGVSADALVELLDESDEVTLRSRMQRIQDELDGLSSQYENIQTTRDSAAEQITLIAEQIALMEQQNAYYAALTDKTVQRMEAIYQELPVLEAEETAQFELLSGLLRLLEENPEVTFWDILFDERSIRDAISQTELYNEVIEYENELMRAISEKKETIVSMKTQLQKDETLYSGMVMYSEGSTDILIRKSETLQTLINELNEQELYVSSQLEYTEAELKEAENALRNPITDEETVHLLSLALKELQAAGLSDYEIRCRMGILSNGLSLVGKVPYFWGGRSYSPGWNEKWNTMQMCCHAGSGRFQLGSYYPYGLDCSGFVFWCALTMYGKDAWESPVEWMAPLTAAGEYAGAVKVSWNSRLPGDIAVNRSLSHIGYYLCRNEAGEPLYLHCCGSYGVVVSTNVLCEFSAAARLTF